MARVHFYSLAQKCDFVLEYSLLPWGAKKQWRLDRDIPQRTLSTWRQQVAAGTLEFGLTPHAEASTDIKFRGFAEAMGSKDKKIAELEKQLAEQKAKFEFELNRERKTADLLGKAIETLEKSSGED